MVNFHWFIVLNLKHLSEARVAAVLMAADEIWKDPPKKLPPSPNSLPFLFLILPPLTHTFDFGLLVCCLSHLGVSGT